MPTPVDPATARKVWRTLDPFTKEGRSVRADIEATTDQAAAAPWSAIGEEGVARLRELARPWSKAMVQIQ